MEPAITVSDLSKQYTRGTGASYTALRDVLSSAFRKKGTKESGKFWALQEVSFDIQKGERIGIIGRNGAGKSTLLKIISQITPPTGGRIVLNGKVASLLEVGTGFHPELTGRENIYLNGAILGLAKKEITTKLEEIIDFSGVEPFIDTPLKHYSSGMQLRLAFSVAAHLEPEILLIDEVLAVGDLEFQKKCLGKMEEVSKAQGRTILFVSHNLEAVKHICEKVLFLENGKVAFFGNSSEGIRRYHQSITTIGISVSHSSAPLDRTKILAAEVTKVEIGNDGHTHLQIGCKIFSDRKQSISFETIIKDKDRKEIVFAPAGLYNKVEHATGVGMYQAVITIELPFMASGEYHVDLLLAHTGKMVIDAYRESLRFVVEGTYLPATGWHFTQAMNQGSVLASSQSWLEPTNS